MAGFGYSKTRRASVPVRCLWRWMGFYTHYGEQLTSAAIKVKVGIVRKKGLNLFLRYVLTDEVDTFLQKIMMWFWQQNFNVTASKLPISQSYQSKNRYNFKQKNTEWFFLNHWFLDHLLMMNCWSLPWENEWEVYKSITNCWQAMPPIFRWASCGISCLIKGIHRAVFTTCKIMASKT